MMKKDTTYFLSIFLGIFAWFMTSEEAIAQDHKSKLEEAFKIYDKGRSFYFDEQYEKSIIYFDSTAAIGRALNEEKIVWNALFLKGNAYMLDDQNQKALDAYYGSINSAKKLKSYEYELMSNSGLVLVYDKTNQYEKALELSNKILSSIDTTALKNTRSHPHIITTSIEAYLDTERYDLVLKYADQGIALSKSFDNKEVLVDLYIKKGVVYYHKKQYDTSLEYLSKAETLLQNHNIKNPFYHTINASYFVASNYYQQKKYDEAIERLHSNIEASKEKDLFKLPVLQSHLLLATCYGKNKDFEQALHWNNEYVKLNEALQKRKNKTIDRVYQKEAQILKGSIADLQVKQLQNERIKKYAYGAAVFLFLILLLGVFLYYKKQKTNKLIFDDLVQKISTLEIKEQVEKKEAHKGIVIDDEKVHEVLKGLSKLESQEFYLRSDCNLRSVAKKVKTNATYLSKIVNIHREKNFNEYINDLRIDYALRRIKSDRKFRSFSVKSIATEIGYKSDYSFAKHFKAKTGLNPSYYIKNIQKQHVQQEKVLV